MRHLTLAVATFVLMACSPSASSGTTVLPATLQDCVYLADIIFAGTVTSIEYERAPSGEMVTAITFTDLEFAKGSRRGQTITMRLAGGREGDIVSFTVDMPVFENGQRYVILADQALGSVEDSYMPIVGLYQGFFPVRASHPGEAPNVLDWNGRPIARVEGGQIIVVDTSEPSQPSQEAHVLRTTYWPKGRPDSSLIRNGQKPTLPSRRSRIAAPKRGSSLPSGTTMSEPPRREPAPSRGEERKQKKVEEILRRGNQPAITVLKHEYDPGTRVSEETFLRILRTL